MTNIEIKPSTAKKLDDIVQQTEKTIDEILELLLSQYGQALLIADELEHDEDKTWTEDELKDLFQPKESLTGKQIVEQGLLGSWADMGIEDGAEWVNQQKAKRRKKYTW